VLTLKLGQNASSRTDALKKRPIHLNFLTISFPLTAWVSVAHRLSGVLLFVLIPCLLWALECSLRSEADFLVIKHIFKGKTGLLTALASLAMLYHLCSGIRHMLFDLGISASKQTAKKTSGFLIMVFLLTALGLGYRLW